MITQSTRANHIKTKPFNPFVILSSYDHTLLFFTQTFAQLSGFHPSTLPSMIPAPLENQLKLELKNYMTIGNYEFHQFKENDPFYYRNLCVDALIHELRTASLAIDLGTHVLIEYNQLIPSMLQKLLCAAHRQKISTIVASDIIQLVTSTPLIYPISLLKILTDGLSQSPDISLVRFRLASPTETLILEHVNPTIWGNFQYLTSFFTSLLMWLKNEKVTVLMEIINPVSVQVTITIPHERFLSSIQGFSLIAHYLHYVAAYFNGRAWVTQTSVNILFPLTLTFGVDIIG